MAQPTESIRRVDSPELATAPLIWQHSPMLVSSVDEDGIHGGTHVEVTNDGYPEGLGPSLGSDVNLLDNLDLLNQQAAHTSAHEATNTRSPAATVAESPEQVVRRLDAPQGTQGPHLASSTVENRRQPPAPPAPTADEDSMVVVEELDVPYTIHQPETDGDGASSESDAERNTIRFPGSDSAGEANEKAEQETEKSSTYIPIKDGFLPAWETDQVQWPRMSERLLQIDDRFEIAGQQLAKATQDGLKVLAVTSTYRGEGRTTIAMNLARVTALHGVRVALVDADVDNPAMASSAGIAAAHGWHECLEGGLPLDEAAVASIGDGVTLLPTDKRRSPRFRRDIRPSIPVASGRIELPLRPRHCRLRPPGRQ